MTGVRLSRARTLRAGLALAAAALMPAARPAAAQGTVPVVVGGVSGLAAGAFVSIGVVTAEARAGRYLHSASDAFGFRSLPVVVGGAAGVALGAADRDRLYDSMLGGAAGGLAGFGAGWLIGSLVWDDDTGSWAGAVMGTAAGILIGSVVGMLAFDEDEDPLPNQAALDRRGGVPVGFSIRF
ncbi:MAG: hypothetical protein ABFS34_08830 [Gemmatimonadota bacterium]